MANLRQSILIRTDLNLPLGLMTAQVAHIHALPLIASLNSSDNNIDVEEWSNDPFVFVHKVPNLEVLHFFRDLAREHAEDLTTLEWHDTITLSLSETQTRAFPSVMVGISLGPAHSDIIKSIIGDLPLL